MEEARFVGARLWPAARYDESASGLQSRRIGMQHRLVYEVLPEHRVAHVFRMWTHYAQAPILQGRGAHTDVAQLT